MVNRIWRPVTEKAKQLTGPNLYPVRSVTTCDGDLCGEKDCKFLLRHRLWSLSVRSLYLLDGLLKQDESLYLQPRVSHDLIQNHKSGDEHTHTHTHHIPEVGTRALAGGVVLQDGCVVDQFPNVIAAEDQQSFVIMFFFSSMGEVA